jgi:hypothetical protein
MVSLGKIKQAKTSALIELTLGHLRKPFQPNSHLTVSSTHAGLTSVGRRAIMCLLKKTHSYGSSQTAEFRKKLGGMSNHDLASILLELS